MEVLEVMQRSLQKRRPPKLRTSGHTLRPRKGKILRQNVSSSGQEHNLVYKPWQNTDMSDILEKLPTLQDGANPWISKLEELLVGTQPAMGDIKKLFVSLPWGLSHERDFAGGWTISFRGDCSK